MTREHDRHPCCQPHLYVSNRNVLRSTFAPKIEVAYYAVFLAGSGRRGPKRQGVRTSPSGDPLETEPGSASITVIDHYRRNMLRPYDFAGVRSTGSKETRAQPVAARCEAGDVWICSGRWNTPFLDELAAFPMGGHDDQARMRSSHLVSRCRSWRRSASGGNRPGASIRLPSPPLGPSVLALKLPRPSPLRREQHRLDDRRAKRVPRRDCP